jgi:outer membrane lipoprotein-sorting protein
MNLALVIALSLSAAPSADDLLAKADAILAPDRFESDVTMATVRANGDVRSFQMHIMKSGDDLHRIRFTAPADEKGTEVLRIGDEMWNYLPNLKRSLRISSKQEFHGGDFNNADVLRVNLSKDYTPKLIETTDDEYTLELKAKNDQVGYDVIKYWLRKKDGMPLRQEYYTSSGKLVRKLEYLDPKTFGKVTRPSRMVMWNMLNRSRHSEMTINELNVRPRLADGVFTLAALGR